MVSRPTSFMHKINIVYLITRIYIEIKFAILGQARIYRQAACALSRMPNAPTIFVTVSKLGFPFGERAL